jgi:hypothetical protein
MAQESDTAVVCMEDVDEEDGNGTKTTAVLPWDKFSSWVHCICIVTFDLELGQALEVSRNATYILAFTK